MSDFTQRLDEVLVAQSCDFKRKPNIYDVTRKLHDEFPSMSFDAIRGRVRRALKKHYSEQAKDNAIRPTGEEDKDCVTTDVEYKSDGTIIFNRIIKLAEGQALTPYDMLVAHGMNPDEWEVISYKNNLWQSQKRGGAVLNLYQSKITVKPIKDKITLNVIKKHFDEFQNTYKPRDVKFNKRNAKYMYEINLADLHLGKFSYNAETGEPLDSKITKERFFKIIKSECARIKEIENEVEEIVFVWTNDFFNSDGISNTTTGGTPQDTDMKWQQLYLTGVDMLVEAIDMLSQYAKVKTFYIASNHSRQTDFYAINYLYAWYKDNKNVDVDRDPHPRYYIEYGVNLIGYAHSYYEKKENLPYLMSVEKPKEFGRTRYREYHLAHYHCEKVEEKGGIIFRWLPSITGTDTWSNDCGYIGAVKRSYSFVYDKNLGMVQINNTIIE